MKQTMTGQDNTVYWLRYLDSLDWRKGELDDCSWRAALRASSLGIEPHAAHDEITARIQAAGGSRLDKISNQLQRAYEQDFEGLNRAAKVSRKFCPERLIKLANQIPETHDAGWLASHSPEPVTITPEAFLASLFEPGECVVVFDRQQSQGSIWRHGRSLTRFVSGCDGVWFLVQPVDGRYHYNPRAGRESQRSEESVTNWRYAVLECDHEPREVYKSLWIRMMVQIPLDIVALIDSGGKSIAAIIRVDAESKGQWDLYGQELKEIFVPLGADPGALTAVRLTRLPGCHRGETGERQTLLWFNPQAKGEHSILEYASRT
jgi:hypothetical protein